MIRESRLVPRFLFRAAAREPDHGCVSDQPQRVHCKEFAGKLPSIITGSLAIKSKPFVSLPSVTGRGRHRETLFIQTCKSGFSLIEIMVVLVVIGILAAAIIPQFIGATHDAKVAAAKSSVKELESAVRRFYVNMDRYPTADEGLKILVDAPMGEEKKWRGPYVDQVRPDPWGNPFQYRVPGTHHPATFDIWSRGADGADGGEGEATDIGNW